MWQATPLYEKAALNYRVRCWHVIAYHAAAGPLYCKQIDLNMRMDLISSDSVAQQTNAFTKAIAAYEKAATGQERLNSPWHSAKHLEKAAECCKELGQTNDMPAW